MAETNVLPSADQRLHRFATDLTQDAGFASVVDALADGGSGVVDGVVGSSSALVVAALAQRAPGPLLVICPGVTDLDGFAADLALFRQGGVHFFPAWQDAPGERLIYDEIYGDRLRTLKILRTSAARPLILSSIQSLLQPVPPADAVAANTVQLISGMRWPAEELLGWLAGHGFHGTSGVELPGEFARRGGIVDVFPPDATHPVRIEWFDDQIESLRRFDVTTQRSLEVLDQVDMTILPSGGDNDMRAAMRRDHFTSYLAPETWIVLVEPQHLEQAGQRYSQQQSSGDTLFAVRDTMARVGAFGRVGLWGLASSTGEAYCRLAAQSVERFSGEISRVKTELEQAATTEHVFLVCQTVAESQRLTEIFAGTSLVTEERLHFITGRLNAGFHLVREQALLLGGAELFRRTDLQRKVHRRIGKKIDSFLDLREGDLVVHLVHGIGRYRGLERLKRENQIEEHLAIEFAGGTRVYVPATKIDLVQKYVGATKARPRLAKIGGVQWQKRRKAAELAVTDMAAELLEVQAERATRPGIAFLPDTAWQQEFDASFPYEETVDQRVAIEAIKEDMLKPTPMDRLLCGDVGFGKTEVAIRAAFKAVDNGYQVAVLVPTTILAEQHYHTFKERMAEFPFSIGRLSRFCAPAEEREIVSGVRDGTIDIVIGTHRIASKDIQFNNLGLLIIDEEQRFGVGVKERLKSLRATVDVLTMSATPIPRTLHMALTGMRDISNLETPPQERVAVETRVARWDDQLIRTAVLRELNRGGQVYFVHNRVQDIARVRLKLQEIVPEATIRVGHGQMHEHELEEVMVDFVAGKFDILLATTIVESGLDIPNANTIFIDAADNYGLSDLHQLRGRVGRYKHRAYCYLLVDKQKHVTPQAAKRLRAIEEFSQMGAGFAIAMRDLEFRGAGNVLGTQQSGHIAAIGYELYCDLLEAAVRRLKRMPPKLKVEVNIDLPGEALLPDDYVPALRNKVDLYRRLSRVESLTDVRQFESELSDRFGPPPPPVLQLLSLAELKIDAAVWQIEVIRLETQDGKTYVVCEYSDRARIAQLARSRGKRVRIVDDRCIYMPLQVDARDPVAVIADVKSVLQLD